MYVAPRESGPLCVVAHLTPVVSGTEFSEPKIRPSCPGWTVLSPTGTLVVRLPSRPPPPTRCPRRPPNSVSPHRPSPRGFRVPYPVGSLLPTSSPRFTWVLTWRKIPTTSLRSVPRTSPGRPERFSSSDRSKSDPCLTVLFGVGTPDPKDSSATSTTSEARGPSVQTPTSRDDPLPLRRARRTFLRL